VVDKLDDDEYLASVRAKISDYTTYPTSFYTKKLFKEDRGTAHISILADGDAVSLTSSINT
jgi:gamma-glutamyltranspeptidase